jgi:hypothetical protein
VLAPAIKAIKPYKTEEGIDGNELFINIPFIAEKNMDIIDNVKMEKKYIEFNGEFTDMETSQFSEEDTGQLKKLIRQKDDAKFNEYLDTEITEIINKESQINLLFCPNILQEYKKYYKEIQIIERIEREIKNLYMGLSNNLPKSKYIRDMLGNLGLIWDEKTGAEYDEYEHRLNILHNRIHLEFANLHNYLQNHKLI